MVTTIEEWSLAFNGFENIVIPDSVTKIGAGAFYGLTEEKINLGAGYPTYFAYSEDGTTLEGHIGTPNSDLDLTTLPEEVTTIGFNVFNGYELSTVTFGSDSNIEIIEGYSFFNSNLTSISLPNSVTDIGDSAFSSNNLTSLTIPNSVTSIGEHAFESNQLETLTFEANSSLVTIQADTFNNAFNKNLTTSVTIPDSVTSIELNAFYQNGINDVTLSSNVVSIGHSAFLDNNLTDIIIPNSVTSIEVNSFYNNSISSLNIPDSVTSIGSSAFHSNSLTSIIIPDNATIGDFAFRMNELTSITIGTDVTLGGSVVANDYNADSEFRDAYESYGAGTYNGNQTEDPQGWTIE